MNCAVDLTSPRAAFDVCLAILATTPNWLQLLAYGVATAAVAGLLVIMCVMLIRRAI